MKLHLTAFTLCGTAAIASTILSMSAPAHTAPSVRIGILSCDVSRGVGKILVRKETMNCTFRPDGGQPASYTGAIDEYGLELGKVDQGHLFWSVAAVSRAVGAGALAGKYTGADAGASVGVGLDANVLVGGTGRSFSLQPLVVDGETGINIAAGVLTVTLRQAD